MDVHKEIDTRGLNCPLPILKAKKALADMASGQVLKVVATDPGSMRDFQAFARQTGNELRIFPERSSVDYRVERIRIDVEHRTEREVNSDRARFGAQHLPELEGEIFGASCAEGHDGREDSTAALRE